jgi:extradiol dioxygenase family protein
VPPDFFVEFDRIFQGAAAMQTTIFHLAFPIGNISDAKAFYIDGLGAVAGRESPNALILNLAGTQLVGHVTPEALPPQRGIYPRHFGLVFTQLMDYRALHDRAVAHNLKFYQPERQRFPGTPLEHWTFFLADPFDNLLEFKHYTNADAIFGELGQTQIGDRD